MNLFVSVVRTLVPLLVGWVIAASEILGIEADSVAVGGAVTAVVVAVYYAAFRGLEAVAASLRWEPLRLVAGALLGWARPPEYPKRPQAAVPRVESVTPPSERL